MSRLVSVTAFVGVLVFGCAASAQRRPRADEQAMKEAMRASEASGENYSSSSAYSHFLKARLKHHEGDHRSAVDELRLALVTDDGNPYLMVSLAEEYARVGELALAEKTLKRVIERHPNSAPAQLLMGRVLSEQRKLSRARVHLRRAIKLAPDDPEAYLTLAQLEMESGRPEPSIAAIESMARAIPDDSRGFRILGVVFSERGDSARAKRMFQRAVEVFPGDYEAWARLGQLYDEESRHVEAEAAYTQALERDPDNIELLLAAGRVSLQIGADARAQAWFDRVLGLTADPELAVRIAFSYVTADRMPEAADVLDRVRARLGINEPRLAFYSALMHEKLRNYTRAADAYAAVPEGAELFLEASVRRGSVLSLSGQHARAAETFRVLQKKHPEFLALYPHYARALERSGAHKSAERVLRDVLQKFQTPELYEALSQNLQRQNRTKDAAKFLEEAIALRPGDAALRFLLGAAYERMGEVDKSLAQVRVVLRENPDHPAALNFIGYVLADHGRDMDEAERLVRRALQLKPDSGAFLDSMGWVYFRRGNAQKAIEYLERAVKLEPEEAVIIDHLGDAYARAARHADAVRTYKQALEVLSRADEPLDGRVLRQSLEQKLKNLTAATAGR